MFVGIVIVKPLAQQRFKKGVLINKKTLFNVELMMQMKPAAFGRLLLVLSALIFAPSLKTSFGDQSLCGRTRGIFFLDIMYSIHNGEYFNQNKSFWLLQHFLYVV